MGAKWVLEFMVRTFEALLILPDVKAVHKIGSLILGHLPHTTTPKRVGKR